MDKKIFIVAKREYLERVRSRWFIVITLAVPALMAAVFAITILITARSSASIERAAHPNSRRDGHVARRAHLAESDGGQRVAARDGVDARAS